MLKIFNKRIMKLSKIKISEEFKNHPPRWTKMLDKQAFYIEHGKYEQPIVVNENNILVDGYTTYKTKEFLTNITDFFKSVDENIVELNKELTLKEGEQEDLLHELELGKLNAIEINKTARRLIKTRKERRKIKDNLEIVKTLKTLANIYYTKGINAEILQTITNLSNLEKVWRDRKYKARVLEDLKCVEVKDEI